MSLENEIKKLTVAVTALTEALHTPKTPVPITDGGTLNIAYTGEPPVPEEAVVAVTEKLKEATPEETATFDRDAALTELTEYVKSVYASAGDKYAERQSQFGTLKEKYGITKVKELSDDKILPFHEECKQVFI